MPYLLLLALLLSGCIQINSEFKPPSGIFYTSVKAPLTTRFNNTPVSDRFHTERKDFLQVPFKLWGTTPSIGFDEEKPRGKSPDGSGRSEIAYADYEYRAVLGIYAKTGIIYYEGASEER